MLLYPKVLQPNGIVSCAIVDLSGPMVQHPSYGMASNSVVFIVSVSDALHPMVLVPKALHMMLLRLMVLPPMAWCPTLSHSVAFCQMASV